MAITIEVFPQFSPRIIRIPAPTTDVVVQDIYNAIRDWEDELDNGIQYDTLISGGGKEELGGGVTVGITITLQNARLMFASRTSNLTSGSATANSSAINDIQILTDSLATFQSDSIALGDTVYNATSSASETIISGSSQTQLTHFGLSGGTIRNDWQIGDDYIIFPNIQCNITGGNLVAIDADGAELDPVIASVNTQVVRSSSSSATLQELSAIQYASFGGEVHLDDTSSNTGTAYPVGTPTTPVNNLTDAKAIATARGFTQIHFVNNHTFSASDDASNLTLRSDDHTQVTLTFPAGATTTGTKFVEVHVTGFVTSPRAFKDSLLVDITDTTTGSIGIIGIENSFFSGSFTLSPTSGGEVHMVNCFSAVAGTATPTFDVNSADIDMFSRNYAGGMRIDNWNNDGNVCSIDLNSGQIKLASTCASGSITVRGVGKVIDPITGLHLLTNTINGGCSLLNETLSPYQLSTTTWEEVHLDVDEGATGTTYPRGTVKDPVNNLAEAVTIAAQENIGIIHLHGTVTLASTYDNLVFKGNSYETSSVIFAPTCSVDAAVFEYIRLSGSIGSGEIIATGCDIPDGLTNVHGEFENCTLAGTFNHMATGYIRGDRCTTSSLGTATFNLSGSAAYLNQNNYHGHMSVTNATNALNSITVTGVYVATLDASCTSGNALVAGIGILTDNSSMTVTDRTIPAAVWEESMNAHLTPGTTGGELYSGSGAGGGGLSAAQTTAAVWGADPDNYKAIGTFGQHFRKLLWGSKKNS